MASARGAFSAPAGIHSGCLPDTSPEPDALSASVVVRHVSHIPLRNLGPSLDWQEDTGQYR
ncbi:hypothetical protein [Asaia lannensis]|uniref:hypothetical protein n=1 Tax=Asaia lannensis TaxID=415421 RepID=UPI003873567C